MRTWTGALALACTQMIVSLAAAQPAPSPSPSPSPSISPASSPSQPGPSGASANEPGAPAPGSDSAPPPSAPMPVIESADPARPNGLAFGIGLGYVLPTSLQTPNTTSVRVRFASGITLEPQLVFANTSDKVDNGATATNKQTEVTLASVVHYPLRTHRKIDLELLGSAGFSVRLINPDGDGNDRTITTLAIGYGIGIGYWITPHWNLSFAASNALVTYARTRQEMTTGDVTVNSSTTLGLVFSPDVTLMIHLFD